MGTAQLDETKLLEQAREFNQEALTQVYQTFYQAIYRYIYRHIGNAQTSEDLASDVFRRFLQALNKGGGPTRQLKAWLYRVAHNLIVDELRRRKHRDHQSLDALLNDTFKDESFSLERLVGDAINMQYVRQALLSLTDVQRQVIMLKFLQGMSNNEVSEITGKSVGAVKALQHRALDALRDQLVDPEPALPYPEYAPVAIPSFA